MKMATNKKTITSESVTCGHPDKICDQISDAILDEFLKKDKESHVAVECLTTTGMVMVAGEVTSEAYVDIQGTVRNTLKQIGYTKPEYGIDYQDCAVLNSIHAQSPDINQGVSRKDPRKQGAGDQGIMYGYACNETSTLMPMPIILAHSLVMQLDACRFGKLKWLRPDGKSQVSIEYENGKPKRISAIVIAAQHDPDVEKEYMDEEITNEIIAPVCDHLIDKNTKIIINGTGKFVKGGPEADTGLTGRKLAVDTYGGVAHHGAGAMSGKDGTKTDRSGAYIARHVAKHLVAKGMAEKCEVGISYAIGVAEPTSIDIDTFGTSKLGHDVLVRYVKEHFDLTPYGIITGLDLKKPRYFKTARYGHFGREDPNFTWEKIRR